MLPGDPKIEHRVLKKDYPHECDSGRKDAKNMRKKNPTEVLERVKILSKGENNEEGIDFDEKKRSLVKN